MLKALIFDVDGTLAETEELHRTSFNHAFEQFGIDWNWNRETYARLLTTTGGKERIVRFANNKGLRPLDGALVAALHKTKNARYAELVTTCALKLRPGVGSLIRDAVAQGLKLGIATTTSRSNVESLMQCCFSEAERECFGSIVCAEDVSVKKPNPEVYLQCLKDLELSADGVIAIEDSQTGLAAARGARLATIVTPSTYTQGDDFSGALAVLPKLPDRLDEIDRLWVTSTN
jgi:HAD superfamily hydrolase (TIGR01509 family)